MPSRMNSAAWRLTLAAATLMALVSGGRTAFGLFVSPLNTASGMGLAALAWPWPSASWPSDSPSRWWACSPTVSARSA